MPNWLDLSSSSNLFKAAYVKGFVDISGGDLITRNGKLLINNDSSLNSNVYVGNKLLVGVETSDYTLDVSGNARFLNDVDICGNITFGNSEFKSNVTVDGDTIMANTLDVSKSTTLSSTLAVGKAATLSDILSVSKATTLNSSLDIVGKTTMVDDVSMNANLKVGGD